MIRVLTRYRDVISFLDAVVTAADSNKDALGFFPQKVFLNFALKEQLYVAVTDRGTGPRYAGHLIFDTNFPKAHVRQVFVLPVERRTQVGKALIGKLKHDLTEMQFISIIARVAEDLHTSNRFWERQDFYAMRVEAGGAAKKRMIVVRAHELASRQLFETSGISAADPLGLDLSTARPKPMYLLDLNVLFDLGPRRQRHEDAIALFRAERMNVCSLAVSSEIEKELQRTARDEKTDPMLSFTRVFPRFAVPKQEELDLLLPKLAAIVFPERATRLSENDVSDLKHLATAVLHALPGLVTSDGRILGAATPLRTQFGIDVISPEAFTADPALPSADQVGRSEQLLSLRPPDISDQLELQNLLKNLGVPPEEMANRWAVIDGDNPVCSRLAVHTEGDLVGYISWPRSVHSQVDASIVLNEQSPVAEDAARTLLNHLCQCATSDGMGVVNLRCAPKQAVARQVAAAMGFTASSRSTSDLQKVALSGFVFSDNWGIKRDLLGGLSNLWLPDEVPVFRHIDQHLPILRHDGQRVLVPLFTLESLLSPALFGLDGRPAVLVPVRPKYAGPLLDVSPQHSFLPKPRTQLFSQRHFVSGPRTLPTFGRGDLIFFYESGQGHGGGAVTAMARVVRAYHRQVGEIMPDDLIPSVIDEKQLSEIGSSSLKTITVFDNVVKLPSPISRRFLIELGCGEPTQLLTSRRLKSEQTKALLRKASIQ